VVAFVLMGNHFHLAAQTHRSNLSRFEILKNIDTTPFHDVQVEGHSRSIHERRSERI
jgi:hypothetical protein